MPRTSLKLILALYILFIPSLSEGSGIVTLNDSTDKIAVSHLKDKSVGLIEHQVNIQLNLAHLTLTPILDDRFPLETRALDRDFSIDQIAFLDKFNKKYSKPDAMIVDLLRVECRYSHGIELGKITPIIHAKWTIKTTSSDQLMIIEAFGVGNKYNTLLVASNTIRNHMLESAKIAYQEALFRVTLSIIEHNQYKNSRNRPPD